MDIRNWFISPSSKQKSKEVIKNEEINLKKTSKVSRKRRLLIASDSDEDSVSVKKKQDLQEKKTKVSNDISNINTDIAKKITGNTSKTALQQKDNGQMEKKEELKHSSVASFFGSVPIERSSKMVTMKSQKIQSNTELNHDDADFCETLQRIDKKAKEVDIKSAPAEKKKRNYLSYISYLERQGPKSLGCKEIPEGAEGCLKGMTFVITGVLESIERQEAKLIIEKYEGKVMNTLTKNTNYVIIGRDAGPSKLEKVQKFETKQLDEDGFFNLLKTLPGKVTSKKGKILAEDICHKKIKEEAPKESSATLQKKLFTKHDVIKCINPQSNTIGDVESSKAAFETKSITNHKPDVMSSTSMFEMWVDKYKPKSAKQIIGQQGDKSNYKKLLHWMNVWVKKHSTNQKFVGSGKWNSQDDGSNFKAVLLSGPPGVGKTTTAQLVCKEAGFDYFELNASDTRSKKNLQQAVSQLLGNRTLAGCFKAGIQGLVSRKHAIIMDEVDGMAGNEDRGGVQELIAFVKSSEVPIICICNDRSHPKIRSLNNYCFDLRFQRPRVEQIKAAMMSIAFKEGMKIAPCVLQDVIKASNQDIRQVLHNLSLWCAKEKGLSAEQAKCDIGRGTKHMKLGPFDVLRDVFAMGKNCDATISDKSDLFFHDYSIAPLFVQENYIHVQPSVANGNKLKHLHLLSETAESICIGDLIDKQVRTQNSWSLLPTQAIFASVIPGELMSGHLQQMINFPAWLGKNSNRNHMNRILQDLLIHMRMRISGNKTDIALDYLPLLKNILTKHLLEKEVQGIKETLKVMEYYYLLRADFDSIIDLSLWPQQADPRSKISVKVKSAFTRTYNKDCGKNPYAVPCIAKKKASAGSSQGNLLDEDDHYLSEESYKDDEKLENDAMIKVKKHTKKATTCIDTPNLSKKGFAFEAKKARARK